MSYLCDISNKLLPHNMLSQHCFQITHIVSINKLDGEKDKQGHTG